MIRAVILDDERIALKSQKKCLHYLETVRSFHSLQTVKPFKNSCPIQLEGTAKLALFKVKFIFYKIFTRLLIN